VPKRHSNGGNQKLGTTSKRGDRYLRGLFAMGALAVIRYAKSMVPSTGLGLPGWRGGQGRSPRSRSPRAAPQETLRTGGVNEIVPVSGDLAELYVRAADFVVRLFAGDCATGMAFEQPPHLKMAIRGKRAASIDGITSLVPHALRHHHE
jgi:hypothetical protein